MLSKVQLFDASKCDDLKTMNACKGCGLVDEVDCIVAVADTAIEYYKVLAWIKEQYEQDKGQLSPRERAIYDKLKEVIKE